MEGYDNYLASEGSPPNPPPTSGKLFVGQIPKDITEPILSTYFEEFGPIKELNIIRDANGMSKGAYVLPSSVSLCFLLLSLCRMCFCNFL
jgi:RNA recognition motif-containing protein